jgi:hypothetical protein
VAHLQAHEVDVNTVTLGPTLEIDGPRERFQNHAAANELAHGFYRDPYRVPDLSA